MASSEHPAGWQDPPGDEGPSCAPASSISASWVLHAGGRRSDPARPGEGRRWSPSLRAPGGGGEGWRSSGVRGCPPLRRSPPLQEARKAVPLISVHQIQSSGEQAEEEDGQESPRLCFSFLRLWFSVPPLLRGQPQSSGLWLTQVISHLLGGMVGNPTGARTDGNPHGRGAAWRRQWGRSRG